MFLQLKCLWRILSLLVPVLFTLSSVYGDSKFKKSTSTAVATSNTLH